MDFPTDSILMSHMGEGNWRVARTDRKPRLIKRPLGIGGLADPPTILFQYQPGPATIATLLSLGGDRFRMIVSEGEVLDTEELPSLEMPYGHFRPDSGVRALPRRVAAARRPAPPGHAPGPPARGLAHLLPAHRDRARGGLTRAPSRARAPAGDGRGCARESSLGDGHEDPPARRRVDHGRSGGRARRPRRDLGTARRAGARGRRRRFLAGAVLAAVHHAEVVAHRVGEPFGSLVLAVAVTVIEVALIVTLMVSGGAETATLARDTVFAAVMITCNGIVGLCLLVGALRHRVAVFNAEGTGTALATVSTLATLSLVLPTFTTSRPGP